MTTFLLASSPLVGPTTLEPLANALGRVGHTVLTPPAPPDLDAYVAVVARDLDAAGPSVMVAFSAAGPRAFAVAAAHRPLAVVFLDARLPEDGVAPDDEATFAAFLDALPIDADGRLPPWGSWWPDDVMAALCPDPHQRADLLAGCSPMRRSMFSRPIPAPPYDGPSGYVLLSDGYRGQHDLAVERGWPARAVAGATHLSPFVDPEPVAAAIVAVAEQLVP